MRPTYIDTLLNNLNDFEKKSIAYHFSVKDISEQLPVREYVQKHINLTSTKTSSFKSNKMLKSRAFYHVTDILTSNYHIHNKGNFSGQDQILLGLKKKILLARVISKSLNQNKTGPFKVFLNTIISEAKKNEVYEILIESLILKKYYFVLKEGNREFEKIDKLITYYELCQKRALFANDCYLKIVINNNLLKFKNDKSFQTYVSRVIRLLKKDYQTYKSAQINYYLHIILMFYFEKQKKYILSAKYCKILFSLVKNSPIIYREARLGFALDNLSQYKTFTENYNEAAKYAIEAQQYYLENSNSYLISKEQEFHVYFYHKKYEKAINCIKELLEHKLVDSGHFTRAKYIYFQSSLLFVQQQYKKALGILNKSLEIEKEKSQWNISLRILNIMLFIELNKIDEASRLLESLRKYVQRHAKTSEIKPRDILIVKVLREMEKDGFNYKGDNKIIAKMLKELSIKGKNTSWEHYSPELIPFHEWLEGK